MGGSDVFMLNEGMKDILKQVIPKDGRQRSKLLSDLWNPVRIWRNMSEMYS